MAQLLNLQYFDDATEKWNVRRPAVPPNALSNRSFSTANLNLGIRCTLPATEYAKQLGSTITPTAATFVTLLEVTQPLYDALLAEPWVRSYYGVTELVTWSGVTASPVPDAPAGSKQPAIVSEVEHGVLILVRRGVNVDFVESLAKSVATSRSPQPLVAVHMRQFISGGSHTVGALHVDPTMPNDARMNYVNTIVEKISDYDNVLLAGNFYHTSTLANLTDRDFKALVLWDKKRTDYTDVCDSGAAGAAVQKASLESSVWWRSKGKIVLEEVQILAPGPSALFQSAVYTKFALSNREGSPPPAGSGGVPLPSLATTQPTPSQFLDPAVVGARPLTTPMPRSLAQQVMANNAASIQQQQQQQANLARAAAAIPQKSPNDKWSVACMISLSKVPRPLCPEEGNYDLTRAFGSVSEAVDRLNSGTFPWPAEYAIVHNTLLSSALVPCDVQTFKQYALSHPPPRVMTAPGSPLPTKPNEGVPAAYGAGAQLPPGIPMTQSTMGIIQRRLPSTGASPTSEIPNHVPTPASMVAPNATFLAHPLGVGPTRQRFWSDQHVTILYQVTPKEMHFDVSQDANIGRSGGLKQVVARLNAHQPGRRMADGKVDRLADWRHDYAVLYCAERSAYWLLAAIDVPCDVHACRYAYGQLVAQQAPPPPPQQPTPIQP